MHILWHHGYSTHAAILTALCAALPGCATQTDPPSPIASTQGVTTVVFGTVTGVREGAGHDANSTDANQALAGVEVTVRFDNNDERSYQVEAGQVFRLGERVKAVTQHGSTRIMH